MPHAYFDGHVGLQFCDRVYVGFWRGPFNRSRVGEVRRAATEIHQRGHRPFGMIAVFDSNAMSLAAMRDPALRQDAAQLQSEFREWFTGGQSIILEGTGFAAAALRATAMAIGGLTGKSASHVFHHDVSRGVGWLRDRMQLTPREVHDLQDVLAQLRERTRNGIGEQDALWAR